MNGHIVSVSAPVSLPKRRKTGGRQKGTPNKRTTERHEIKMCCGTHAGCMGSAMHCMPLHSEAPRSCGLSAKIDQRQANKRGLRNVVSGKRRMTEEEKVRAIREKELKELRKVLDEMVEDGIVQGLA